MVEVLLQPTSLLDINMNVFANISVNTFRCKAEFFRMTELVFSANGSVEGLTGTHPYQCHHYQFYVLFKS